MGALQSEPDVMEQVPMLKVVGQIRCVFIHTAGFE